MLKSDRSYRFGQYRLDAGGRLLYKDGQLVPLPPKVFDTLFLLVASRGHLVTKDEMMKGLWPDTFVEENTLGQYISQLRKVLGGDRDWIENLPRRGYRFTAPVDQVEEPAAAPQAAPASGNGTPVAETSALDERRRNRFRNLAAGLAVLVALAGAAAAVWFNSRQEIPGAGGSVAVLPFRTVADSPDNYVADGVTETIITRLANVKGLRVVSYSRVRQYRGHKGEAAKIGRQLGVDAVIEGTVRVDSGQIRFTVHGVDTRSGNMIWAIERLEANSENLLKIEGDLAEAAARRFRGDLTANERKLIAKPVSSSAQAYDLFLKARVANPEAAIPLLSRAIELDPDFADAYGLLALAQQQMFMTGIGGPETSKTARSNANRALSLNPNSPVAVRALGFAQINSGRVVDSLIIARRTLEDHPDDLDAIAATAEAYFRAGLSDRAIPLYEKALAGEPGSVNFRTQLARIFLFLGQHENGMRIIAPLRPEASGPFGMLLYSETGQQDIARRIARVNSLGPHWLFATYMSMYVLTSAGDPAGAREIGFEGVRTARRFLDRGENPWIYAFRGMVQARLGRRTEALESARRAVALDPGNAMFLFFAAQTQSLLGMRREALATLNNALENGFLNLPMLEYHSRPGLAFHILRDHPEFAAIRADMGKRIDALRARY